MEILDGYPSGQRGL